MKIKRMSDCAAAACRKPRIKLGSGQLAPPAARQGRPRSEKPARSPIGRRASGRGAAGSRPAAAASRRRSERSTWSRPRLVRRLAADGEHVAGRPSPSRGRGRRARDLDPPPRAAASSAGFRRPAAGKRSRARESESATWPPRAARCSSERGRGNRLRPAAERPRKRAFAHWVTSGYA